MIYFTFLFHLCLSICFLSILTTSMFTTTTIFQNISSGAISGIQTWKSKYITFETSPMLWFLKDALLGYSALHACPFRPCLRLKEPGGLISTTLTYVEPEEDEKEQSCFGGLNILVNRNHEYSSLIISFQHFVIPMLGVGDQSGNFTSLSSYFRHPFLRFSPSNLTITAGASVSTTVIPFLNIASVAIWCKQDNCICQNFGIPIQPSCTCQCMPDSYGEHCEYRLNNLPENVNSSSCVLVSNWSSSYRCDSATIITLSNFSISNSSELWNKLFEPGGVVLENAFQSSNLQLIGQTNVEEKRIVVRQGAVIQLTQPLWQISKVYIVTRSIEIMPSQQQHQQPPWVIERSIDSGRTWRAWTYSALRINFHEFIFEKQLGETTTCSEMLRLRDTTSMLATPPLSPPLSSPLSFYVLTLQVTYQDRGLVVEADQSNIITKNSKWITFSWLRGQCLFRPCIWGDWDPQAFHVTAAWFNDDGWLTNATAISCKEWLHSDWSRKWMTWPWPNTQFDQNVRLMNHWRETTLQFGGSKLCIGQYIQRIENTWYQDWLLPLALLGKTLQQLKSPSGDSVEVWNQWFHSQFSSIISSRRIDFCFLCKEMNKELQVFILTGIYVQEELRWNKEEQIKRECCNATRLFIY